MFFRSTSGRRGKLPDLLEGHLFAYYPKAGKKAESTVNTSEFLVCVCVFFFVLGGEYHSLYEPAVQRMFLPC